MFDERVSQAEFERPAPYQQDSISDAKRDKANSKTSHRRNSVGMLFVGARYPMLI